MDAGTGMGKGDADVDDDGFVGPVYPSEVVDRGGVRDARDSARM